ncbi:MAG TPA: DUF3465 domain-containing protein [Pyrinomonadaceae bacterium]|nr:DUF3465 domain-containing protein [Pyrinomonadaceae bacterium]
MNRLVSIGAIFLICGAIACRSAPSPAAPGKSTSSNDHAIAAAYESHSSGLQVEGEGTVTRLLSDDLQKPRHQRFILQLDSGQTLLVAHNIDLAPRVEGLTAGDRIQFSGVYEWNDKGGLIHWTHRDPSGKHQAGWLKYRGNVYQ